MLRFLVIFLICIVAVSCTEKSKTNISAQEINLIKKAKTLRIIEQNGDAHVTITDPDHGKKWYFVLSPTFPKTKTEKETWIQTPIRSVIPLSGTIIGMLSKLNKESIIKGVSDARYIFSNQLKKAIKHRNIIDFGGNESIPYEKIIFSKTQLLIYSSFGSEFSHAEQLLKAGTVCLPIYDWREEHPLGKAEWIKLTGYLTGEINKADSLFKAICQEYNLLIDKAKNYANKPNVFSGNLTGDIWFCPVGESYYAQLIKDAGGNYIYEKSKGTGSLSLSLERVMADNKNTPLWLNPGFSSFSALQSANPKAALFSAFQKKNVFCYSKNMNKYWELAAIEPQHVLSDLITIFHSEKIHQNKLYFYSKLDE